MLDFDTTFELMKKYGYSSTVHPYIYQNGETMGICYTYIDEDYGTLERIKLFEDADSLEEFLKKLEWIKTNGKNYNVRMALDNYESMNPKVIFLRNEKIMVEGEMFNIDTYDYRESQRLKMDDVSKVIYEAGDLLLVYDEIKGRQLQYLKSIVRLKNTLRQKYYDLQCEVDKYNKYKVERALVLLPEVADIGINEMLEINIKDRYNMYVAQRPSYQEAVDFVREVWDLNKSLELNVKYYEAMKEENDVRNEIKIVEQKLELMKDLNDNYKPLFGVDLVGKFRKINKTCRKYSNSISTDFISENINTINRKYAVFDNLDLLYTSDYLREAIQNTNYADLAIKYSKDKSKQEVNRNRKPLNEVASSLSIQYRDRLSSDEQAILVIFNNHKYRKLCNAILQVENFAEIPVKKLISKINGIKGFSKIKSECYDVVKRRLSDPINQKIKNMLFKDYDFSTFETFISSLIKELVKLKNVNNKMTINGDINMYLIVNKVEDISKERFLVVTNSLNSLLIDTKDTNKMIGITLLKENSPVLYSPYYFDVGDIYSKNASLQMNIKEMVDFELLVDTSDIVINVDPYRTNVVRYYSEPTAIENILVVNDLKMNYKTTFCKFAFTSNIVGENVVNQPQLSTNVSLANNQSVSNIPKQDVQSNSGDIKTQAVNNVNLNNSTVTSKKEEEKVVNQPQVGANVSSSNNQSISNSSKSASAIQGVSGEVKTQVVNNVSSNITQGNQKKDEKVVLPVTKPKEESNIVVNKVVENKKPVLESSNQVVKKVDNQGTTSVNNLPIKKENVNNTTNVVLKPKENVAPKENINKPVVKQTVNNSNNKSNVVANQMPMVKKEPVKNTVQTPVVKKVVTVNQVAKPASVTSSQQVNNPSVKTVNNSEKSEGVK